MKLEKIYSPKKIYRNFYSFAKENSLGKNQILVAIIFIFFFTAIIALLKAIIVKSSKGMNIFNFNNGIPILNVFFMLLAILVIFNILITIFKWNFKLMLSGDKLIDMFPREKIYTFDEIESILLVSPHFASILIQPKSSPLKRNIYWFGNGEEEWQAFLDFILHKKPSLEKNIYVNSSRWNALKIMKISPKESYAHILELYGEK